MKLDRNIKFLVILLCLALPSLAFAADSGGRFSDFTEKLIKMLETWLSSGRGGASSAGRIVGALERQSILLFALVSRLVLAGGVYLAGSSIINYIRTGQGKEQVSAAHLRFFAGLMLVSALPLLHAFGNSLGFSDPDTFKSVSKLAQACGGTMGVTCNAGNDPEDLKNAFVLTIFRMIRFLGFASFCYGIFSIHKLGQNNNGHGKGAVSVFILSGIFLFYFVNLMVAVGNTYFGDSDATRWLRGIYQGNF